jgi:hypothetical protein
MHLEGDGYILSEFIISAIAGDAQKNHERNHWKADQDSNSVPLEKELQLPCEDIKKTTHKR